MSGKSSRNQGLSSAASTRIQCAYESLVGLSVGDALGAQFEGADFDPARLDAALAPEGVATWTDDTEMALSVVECLVERGTIDQDQLAVSFGRRFDPWRGYGRGMQIVLPKLRKGMDWRRLSETVFRGGSLGNGSAMRVAPLGAYFHDCPVDRVTLEAEGSAEVTHAHPEALAGAAAIGLAAWFATRSRGKPAPALGEICSAICAPLGRSLAVTRCIQAAGKMGANASLRRAVGQLGNGSTRSCADTVPIALWVAFKYLDDFRSAIHHAVAAGGDTDTVAAMVGGIVGARVGIEGIPEEWHRRVEPIPVHIANRTRSESPP